MAYSLHANLRYRIIDRCLKDLSRPYFHEEIADAIQQEFDELGLDLDRPSKRTIDYDISNMRSGKLGYEAPIIFSKDDGYRYSDPGFSLYKLTINRQSAHDLTQTLLLMKQMSGIESMPVFARSITLLEQELQIKTEGCRPIIYYEESTNDLGKPWISILYDKIRRRQTLNIHYQPFDRQPRDILLAPYNLYEFYNRWYLVGWQIDKKRIAFISLDRIIDVNDSIFPYFEVPGFDIREYMAETFGIRRPDNASPQTIRFMVTKEESHYIRTKPIHRSQKLLDVHDDYDIYQLKVVLNHEIKYKLLSYGASLEVLKPLSLRHDIMGELKSMANRYGLETHEKFLFDISGEEPLYDISCSIAIVPNKETITEKEIRYENTHEFYD